ncbi:replication initiation negative regulator SeqA [Aliidiomarina soli]|uniref:Negative modulator of initiation of replication n=1 Tax=Aliidiomarina soli TaxID=1928574 RepID=A0A432WHH7_9GAMM|nr:replication initiation negative regulator SeqA [Aliidiomarina soli]RUO33276.1 replication initiation negative regulator SeqA [Aliidiomarina soli]
MKRIEIDDDIYTYIAANTEHIGESASDILRRLLQLQETSTVADPVTPAATKVATAGTSTQRTVFDVITSADFAAEKSVVGRFLHILSMLYRCHGDAFQVVLDIKGRDRIYFATSEQALLESGNSTNPKQIPQSPYWVITNSNTTKKKSMLTQVATGLGYTPTDAEKIRDFL